MTDVNLRDVVQVLAVFLSPSVHQLRSSVDLVVPPSVQYGGEFVAVFRESSSCIHGFGMICLPWIMLCPLFFPLEEMSGLKPDAALTHIQTTWS